jgi:TRAP-type C4-dicarboxylate transport system permease small subunit
MTKNLESSPTEPVRVDLSRDETIHIVENVVPGPSPIEDGCEVICCLYLLAMIVLIGAEAIARNVFGTSLQVTDEVGGYLLVALTFLSMAVAEAHGAFHRVEFVQVRLGFRARMIYQIAFELISLVASAIVTWQLARLTINSWYAEDVAATPLQTPLWLPQSSMAVGMLLLCFALIRTTITKFERLRSSAS